MVKRTDSRMVIKEHRPWRGWLCSLLLVAGGGIVGWLLPLLLEASPGSDKPPSEHNPLQERLSHLEQENTRLREHGIQIQRELEVEQQTRADLSTTVIALQDEILELKRQLATYKGVVKSLQEQALRIQKFIVGKTGTERLFRYRLVLTQGRKIGQFTQGKVEFIIHGVLNGKPTRLGLDALSKNIPLSFKFKYFQILEGEFLLPESFKPTRVKITLLPQGDPHKLVERTFNWASLEN